MRTKSRLFLLLLIPVSISPLFIYTLLGNQGNTDVGQRNISILLWHWPFGRSYSLTPNTCGEMYNISHCFLTNDASALSMADVVVFHHHELGRGAAVLPPRQACPALQHWVWMSMEPPVNNPNLARLNGVFNWTMSYRRDADIHIPYGRTLAGSNGWSFRAPANRSCLVSWVVSRYQQQQARARVYQSLKQHIPIQVYGRWSKKRLPDAKLLPTIGKCLFYLSFENSEARDYISEKLWRNALQAGAVPVVLGPSRSTYEALAPPNSFIHVADFKSAADLASYLKRVAKDTKAYEGYFQWRRTHRIQTYTDWRERLCHICVQFPWLPAHKVYKDLQSWVNS